MSGVQSVARAFALLEAIGDGPATLTDLARRVDLPISTASRLLSTLEDMGAIERIDGAAQFRIGASIVQMASSVEAGSTLAAVARPELESLTGVLDEASGLSVTNGSSMHYLEQVDADQAVQVRDWVGSRLPMHLISSGLVVMAHWTEDAVDTYLDRELLAPTEFSVKDPDEIRSRLACIRDSGFAWALQELELTINSVAAPVFNSMGEVVCAIHLHGPAFRFPGVHDRGRIEKELCRSADRISNRLSA